VLPLTTSARPDGPESIATVTEETRAQVYREYGFNFDHCQGPERGVSDEPCEVDHLIPLELGGSNDLNNLWPQPYSCANRQTCAVYDPRLGAAEKDQLENTFTAWSAAANSRSRMHSTASPQTGSSAGSNTSCRCGPLPPVTDHE